MKRPTPPMCCAYPCRHNHAAPTGHAGAAEAVPVAARQRLVAPQPGHICTGSATSAPGLAHLTGLTHPRNWIGLTRATSAPELGSPLPHLHQNWAPPCHICTRDWARPCDICTGTGLAGSCRQQRACEAPSAPVPATASSARSTSRAVAAASCSRASAAASSATCRCTRTHTNTHTHAHAHAHAHAHTHTHMRRACAERAHP